MKLKKIIPLAMSSMMIISLAACADSGNNNTSDKKTDNSIKTESIPAAMGEGEGYGTKEETVYVTTSADGTIEKILVSNWLKNTKKYASLKDVTNLKDIVNVKGSEPFNMAGGEITFETAGNDIYYQGSLDKSTTLPVSLKITYKLDGQEISGDSLKGKSGKLNMTIEYIANEKTDDGIYIPFLAVTGMLLPTDSFRNVEVTNGQVISNGDYNILIGMGLPGISESLSLNIPNKVEITADVTNYDIDMMMTVVTNKALSEISLDEETDLSSISDMISLLSESSLKLSDGAAALNEGLLTLQGSSKDLAAGIEKLNTGAQTIDTSMKTLSAGAAALYDGINTTLLTGANALNAGLNELYNGAVLVNSGVGELVTTVNGLVLTLQNTITQNNKEIDALNVTITTCKAQIADLTNKKTALETAINSGAVPSAQLSEYQANLNTINGAIAQYEEGIQQCNAGILQYQGANTAINNILSQLSAKDADGKTINDKLAQLKAGTQSLEDGIKSAGNGSSELVNGINTTLAPGAKQLADGSSQLHAGTSALADGLKELNDKIPALVSGINQLVTGSGELSSGMNQFNENAIQKISELYNNDLKAVMTDLNKVLEAGKGYSALTGIGDDAEGTTTFIIKTN